MKAELIPQDGSPPIPITKDVTVLGRRGFCDVVIEHASLSKRHCVLVRTDGLLMVRDLASTNGTKVNGQRVSWAALMPNDRITLGRCKFKVYLGSEDAPSPSEEAKWRRQTSAPVPRTSSPPLAHSPSAFPPPPLQPMEFAAPSRESSAPSPGKGLPNGSTDPDSDLENLDEFILDDDDEPPFVIDLD